MSFAKAAGVLVVIAGVTKVLGFVSDQIVAAFFGASAVTDAYVLAVTFSVFVFNLLGVETASTLVPMLTDAQHRGGKERLARVTGEVLGAVSLVALVVIGLILLFASPIVSVVASGAPPETVRLTTKLIYVVIPALWFMISGAFLASALAALKHFTVPALGPALTNILIISAAVLYGRTAGVVALSVATAIGMVATAIMNWLTLRNFHVPLSLRSPWKSTAVPRLLRLGWPTVLSNGALQLATMIDRVVAASMAIGTVSALNFAFKLMQLPLGLFTTAAPVILSSLSEAAVAGKKGEYEKRLERSMTVTLLLVAPLAVGLFVEARPIIRVAFEHGAFTSMDTARTAAALRWYAPAVCLHVLNFLLIRAHFALERTRATLWAILAGVVANIAGDFLLAAIYGYRGIAMANVLNGLTAHLALLISLRGIVREVSWGRLYARLGSIALGGVIMAGVMQWVAGSVFYGSDGVLETLAQIGTSGLIGLAVFSVWAALTGTLRAVR